LVIIVLGIQEEKYNMAGVNKEKKPKREELDRTRKDNKERRVRQNEKRQEGGKSRK